MPSPPPHPTPQEHASCLRAESRASPGHDMLVATKSLLCSCPLSMDHIDICMLCHQQLGSSQENVTQDGAFGCEEFMGKRQT